MAQIRPSTVIEGVYIAELQSHGDERGRFTEVYRKEWFPQHCWDDLQWSRSESQRGVLRGLHYHQRQVDYWHCGMGALRVGLLDLRRSSPTRGQGLVIELDQEVLRGVFIPGGSSAWLLRSHRRDAFLFGRFLLRRHGRMGRGLGRSRCGVGLGH